MGRLLDSGNLSCAPACTGMLRPANPSRYLRQHGHTRHWITGDYWPVVLFARYSVGVILQIFLKTLQK